jgi:uncharacterized repeat protein (TIGR01451 family)
VEVEALAAPPELAPLGGTESDSAYIERLLRADGSARRTQAFAMGTFAGQRVFGAMVVAPTTLDVPVLRLLGPEVSDEAAADDVLDVRMTVTNVSETEAVAVTGTRSVGATTVAPSLAASLDPGEVTDAAGTHTLTAGVAGTTVSVVREVVWEDGAGNSYGPLSLNRAVDVAGLPAMALTLVDSLHTDADSNGVITEGDTVQLQVVVKAGPSAGLTSVEVELPLVEDLSLASATVSQGSYSTSTAGDVTTVTFTVGSLSANGTATLSARFVVLTPSPVFLTHQATGEATGLTGVLSDDPMLPGHADPTTTRVIGTDAELESWLGWRLLTDIDGNGVPSPGDTLRYEGAVSNGGLAAADDVVISVPVDPGGTLVAGTAWASAGTVTSGSLSTDTEVEITITSIAGQASATWRYDVSVGFLASLVGDMTTQGQLTLDTDPAGSTDDPRTEAAGDETVIPVSTTPYPDRTGYAGPYPTVSFVSPEPGARLGVPTGIVAEVAPTDGEDVVYWRAVMWEDGLDLEPTVLAYGLTDPPEPPLALATLDTTLLRNGLYTVRVEVIDSAGLMGWADAPVEIAGDFKPGAMRVAFVDGSYALPVGGDLQVVRVYDNLDRHVSGDFGYGWHLELLGMRIQTNGPLGQGGWTQVGCGVGMFYGTQCFEAVKPHLVVLTWPDGRQESWDFLPDPVSSYFNALAEPGFVPRAGTTSSIAVAPGTGTGFFVAEDGNIYSGLAGRAGTTSRRRMW